MRKSVLLWIAGATTAFGLLLLAPTHAAAQCCDKACVDVDGDGAEDDSIRCAGLVLGGLIPNPTSLRGCEELDPGQFCIGGRLLPGIAGALSMPSVAPTPATAGLLIDGCVCDALTGACRDGTGATLTEEECTLAAATACGPAAISQINDTDCDPCAGLNCDDANPCTTDSCSAGQCIHAPASCSDGDACTTDTCDPATGCAHAPVSCDDGNACTTDTCDPNTGCGHVNTCHCGNAVIEPGEQCDDGNNTNGDGCSSTCQVEGVCCSVPNLCVQATSCDQCNGTTCNVGQICTGDAGIAGFGTACQGGTPPVCGNSVVEQGEQCDDGNTNPGDGCSATCQTEAVCGNGTVEGNEQCDDGNNGDGDGCSATCTNESVCCTSDVVPNFCLPAATCDDCIQVGNVFCNPNAICPANGQGNCQ
jgi:cysteine-rich repeat protein